MHTGSIQQGQACFAIIDLMISDIFDNTKGRTRGDYRLVLGTKVEHCLIALAPSNSIGWRDDGKIVPELAMIRGVVVEHSKHEWAIGIYDRTEKPGMIL